MRTYARKNSVDRRNTLKAESEAASGPSIGELAAGAAPTGAQMGHRVDLPEEIREKMESSFGADFSGVRLYESETVAEAGARAVTQGSNIAFAPGKLDLTSTAGQAVLGHELSHVVSQARGESTGKGFLNDPALEAQADRQGMMAARGESVSTGPVSPVGVSSTSGAAGPMQAMKVDKDIAKATESRKVEFGKAGDLTGMIRNAKAENQDARGRLSGTAAQEDFYNRITDNNSGDMKEAYRKRWKNHNQGLQGNDRQTKSWGFEKLLEGTTAKRLREDEGGFTLGGGGGGDRIYSKEEADRRYLEDHPADIMSGYDESMLEGLDSIYKMQREWKRRGIR